MKKVLFLMMVMFFLATACEEKESTTTTTTVVTVTSSSTTTTTMKKVATTSTTTTTTSSTTTTTTINTLTDDGVDNRLKFVITEETDEDTLYKHMKNLFNAIEEKISLGDFKGWYNSISSSYKHYISDPSTLQKLSRESPYLASKNIDLKTPRDFFEHIVVGARQIILKNRQLGFSDYEIVDKFHVKVIATLDEGKEFKYNFVYEGDAWKLDR